MSEVIYGDDFYDISYKDRVDDVNFYIDSALKYGSGGILEIGCGTGRVLVKTAELGLKIDGLDPVKHRIDILKEKINSLPSKIQSNISLFNAKIQDYKTDKKYSLLTMPFRVFQHILTPAEQKNVLNVSRDLLQDNGTLIIDIFNPNIKMLANDKYLKEFGATRYTTKDGKKIVRKDRIQKRDYVNQIQFCEEIYEYTDENGAKRRLVDEYVTRYTFKQELEYLLQNSGFDIVKVYGDFNKTQFGKQTYPGDIVMVAQKQH